MKTEKGFWPICKQCLKLKVVSLCIFFNVCVYSGGALLRKGCVGATEGNQTLKCISEV